MSNSPLSDKCEVDPHSTTATRKWPAKGTTGSTLSPPPRAATKGGRGEEDPRARAAFHATPVALTPACRSSKQAGTSANRNPSEGASGADSAPPSPMGRRRRDMIQFGPARRVGRASGTTTSYRIGEAVRSAGRAGDDPRLPPKSSAGRTVALRGKPKCVRSASWTQSRCRWSAGQEPRTAPTLPEPRLLRVGGRVRPPPSQKRHYLDQPRLRLEKHHERLYALSPATFA